MARLAVVSLACCLLALVGGQTLKERLDSVEGNARSLVAQFQQIQDGFDAQIKALSDADKESANLNFEIDESLENAAVCADDMYQCGTSLQCVSRVLVCDGSPDCANGADENQDCGKIMLKRGQKWLGRFKYNTCFASLSIDATLVLEGQTFMRRSWFGNVADITYTLTSTSRTSTQQRQIAVKGRGWFNYGKNLLRTYVTDGLKLILICKLEPGKDNHFHCQAYRYGLFDQQEPCAEIVFFVQ